MRIDRVYLPSGSQLSERLLFLEEKIRADGRRQTPSEGPSTAAAQYQCFSNPVS